MTFIYYAALAYRWPRYRRLSVCPSVCPMPAVNWKTENHATACSVLTFVLTYCMP